VLLPARLRTWTRPALGCWCCSLPVFGPGQSLRRAARCCTPTKIFLCPPHTRILSTHSITPPRSVFIDILHIYMLSLYLILVRDAALENLSRSLRYLSLSFLSMFSLSSLFLPPLSLSLFFFPVSLFSFLSPAPPPIFIDEVISRSVGKPICV